MNSDEIAENPVLPEPFEQLIKKEIDIPVMVSHTSNEFIMFLQSNFSFKKDKSTVIIKLYLYICKNIYIFLFQIKVNNSYGYSIYIYWHMWET